MADTSREPGFRDDERATLAAWLDHYRATVVAKLDGLSEEQVRRPMVPSGLCLLGIVRHLALNEQYWFVTVASAGSEQLIYQDPSDPDFEFRPDPGESTQEAIANYRRQCERSDSVLRDAASLDEVADFRGEPMSLRRVASHMLEETARHAGHADILRELIDGRTG